MDEPDGPDHRRREASDDLEFGGSLDVSQQSNRGVRPVNLDDGGSLTPAADEITTAVEYTPGEKIKIFLHARGLLAAMILVALVGLVSGATCFVQVSETAGFACLSSAFLFLLVIITYERSTHPRRK